MTSNRPTAETIFHDAMELEEEARPAFLDDACGDDQPLRREVDDLLADYTRAGFSGATGGCGGRCDFPTDGEHPGSQIGPYQLLEEIGEGGFGVVYRAEQREPVRRKVALKVIKPGMDTREVVARFEAERQALAMMDHPSIAHVLDAGATEHGRPISSWSWYTVNPLPSTATSAT